MLEVQEIAPVHLPPARFPSAEFGPRRFCGYEEDFSVVILAALFSSIPIGFSRLIFLSFEPILFLLCRQVLS